MQSEASAGMTLWERLLQLVRLRRSGRRFFTLDAELGSYVSMLAEQEQRPAEAVIREITAMQIWDDPIVTQLAHLQAFFEAEAYHQEYFKHNPYQGYCQVVVAPKVAKFRKKFANKLKSS